MPRGKKAKTRKKTGAGAAEPGLISRLLSDEAAGLRRGALTALIVTTIGVVGLFGLRRLREHVHALNHFERTQLWVFWEHCPDFLLKEQNEHILRRLEHEIALTPGDTILDAGLAERVVRSLSRPEIGWVERVRRVVVRPNGCVSIQCDFRKPVAYIAVGQECYLVDHYGIRLPGEYQLRDCELNQELTIRGVAAPVPNVGQPWTGDDIASGLRLASMLDGQPFRDQVASINVENHDGRISPQSPHLVLATNRPGSRIWWGRPPDEENGIENSARQKLALLHQLYTEYGRIDINQPYIDVRTFPNSVTVPRSSHGT